MQLWRNVRLDAPHPMTSMQEYSFMPLIPLMPNPLWHHHIIPLSRVSTGPLIDRLCLFLCRQQERGEEHDGSSGRARRTGLPRR